MFEFQIIPAYVIGEEIIFNLCQQLRRNNVKKIYLIKENISHNNKFYKEFKSFCSKYEISIHEENVDFGILDENKFNYYINCLNIGLPDCFVVFGSETALNIAKLLNYLIGNKQIKSLDDFIKQLNNKNEYPLKLFSVINSFTYGSENNFFGILKIKYQQKIKRYAFNANTISSFIYTNSNLFKNLSKENIQINLISTIIKLIEYYTASSSFEWTKNYILGNLQTIIEVIDKYNIENQKDIILKNLIWTNLVINSGIANFLNNDYWILYIFGYEIADKLNINIDDILVLIIEPYINSKLKNNENFKNRFSNLIKNLFGKVDNSNLIHFFSKIFDKLNINIFKTRNISLFTNLSKNNFEDIIKNTLLKLNEFNINEEYYNSLFKDIINELINDFNE